MARQKNDGKGRLGGRAKGTPNKVTTDLKTWVSSILDDGRDKFVENLSLLEPSEYIRTYTGLLNYVMPKQQAATPEQQAEAQIKALESLLDRCPDKFIDEITAKIMDLRKEAENEQ